MRILHITTTLYGGAGLAAQRLYSAQKLNGDSVWLYSNNSIFSENEIEVPCKRINVLKGRIVTVFQFAMTKPAYSLMTPYSISRLNRSFLAERNFDIVHVHNWYNLLSLEDLKWLLDNFKVVFTMHDERLLTGGCHYMFNCENALTSCNECPAVKLGSRIVHKSKIEIDEIFGNARTYAVTAPSDWLRSRSLKYALGKNAKISKSIPNILHSSLENREFQLKPKNQNMIFSAAKLDVPTKGFDLFIEALKLVNQRISNLPQISIYIAGDSTNIEKIESIGKFRLIYTGLISSEDMSDLLENVGISVIASRMENAPSFVLECQLSSVAVVATRVGGIPEMIEESNTGYLTEPTAESLCNGIIRCLASPNLDEIREKAFKSSKKRQDIDQILESYKNVYFELAQHA